VASFISLLGVSMPVYVVAPLIILLFAVVLQWFPAGGWGGGAPRYIVLPVVSMALPYVAYVTRITRAGFLDTLQQPFIRAARARGLSTGAIVFRHALRPALVPLVAYWPRGGRAISVPSSSRTRSASTASVLRAWRLIATTLGWASRCSMGC
jgi:ABC-type dipeptide/oligopeptide/nickel transport system permease component